MSLGIRENLKGETRELVNVVIPSSHVIESAEFENGRLIVLHSLPDDVDSYMHFDKTKTTIHTAPDGCIKFFSEDAS